MDKKAALRGKLTAILEKCSRRQVMLPSAGGAGRSGQSATPVTSATPLPSAAPVPQLPLSERNYTFPKDHTSTVYPSDIRNMQKSPVKTVTPKTPKIPSNVGKTPTAKTGPKPMQKKSQGETPAMGAPSQAQYSAASQMNPALQAQALQRAQGAAGYPGGAPQDFSPWLGGGLGAAAGAAGGALFGDEENRMRNMLLMGLLGGGGGALISSLLNKYRGGQYQEAMQQPMQQEVRELAGLHEAGQSPFTGEGPWAQPQNILGGAGPAGAARQAPAPGAPDVGPDYAGMGYPPEAIQQLLMGGGPGGAQPSIMDQLNDPSAAMRLQGIQQAEQQYGGQPGGGPGTQGGAPGVQGGAGQDFPIVEANYGFQTPGPQYGYDDAYKFDPSRPSSALTIPGSPGAQGPGYQLGN